MTPEETLNSRRIYSGRVVGLRVDTVRLPDGRTTQREIVEHSEAVAIVPLDARSNAIMVRQYRKPVERQLLEIPAGGIEPGESPEAAAARELKEETGYSAGKIERIGGIYSAPGFCQEYLHLFLATDLVPGRPEAEEDESIELVMVPLQEVPNLIASGQICDAKSVAALLLVATAKR
ncbi:MAG: NUDIX hydrolase [Chloroflexi bacterium]|nr:NUDIX hydrolase [Chloroflexota bacterium]